MAGISMSRKAYFSEHADAYATFRPRYPDALIRHICKMVKYRGVAWDCACENGQLAVLLSKHFQLVMASDISAEQIALAPGNKGILYTVQSAEQTDFPEEYFDLIVVGQAIHRFCFEDFYAEVFRVLGPKGIIVAIGYGLLSINSEIDKVIHRLYREILGDFWPPERRFIEEAYTKIPWPFEDVMMPDFAMQDNWTKHHLLGYLNTWSAVKLYEKVHRINPVSLVATEIEEAWGGEHHREVRFPIFTKAGKKKPVTTEVTG